MQFKAADNPRPLIPEGFYEAACIKCDTAYFCRSPKLFLHFEIIESDLHSGVKLFMPFSMPPDGKLTPGRKYYKAWIRVKGCKQPSRNATMSPKMFLNKLYKIKVKTVKTMDKAGELPGLKYSLVEYIVEALTGKIDIKENKTTVIEP